MQKRILRRADRLARTIRQARQALAAPKSEHPAVRMAKTICMAARPAEGTR